MRKFLTIVGNLFRRPSLPQVTEESTNEKMFNDAFEVFRTEFLRLVRESSTELSKSLVRLATSSEFQRSASPYVLRQKVYQESVEKLGNSFVSALKSIILPHCDIISDHQLNLLKQELRRVINSKLEGAKSGTTSFAASLGHSNHTKSAILPLESMFLTTASRFEDIVISTVKQANLQRAHEKSTKPVEIKPERTRLQKYQDYFSNHKFFSVIIFLAIVVAGVATFTDSLHKLSTVFSSTPKVTSAPTVIVFDVVNQDSVDIQIDPLCEFYLTEETGTRIEMYPKGRATLVALQKENLLPDFILKAGTSRSYSITLPQLSLYHSLLDRGAANIHFIVFKVNSREFGIGSMVFQKDYINRYKGQLIINDDR